LQDEPVTDVSKNGILDANALCSFVSNHSDPRSSISSSCRSSKCCCSSYDCSYCSPPESLNSESHTVDDGEDDTHQESIDTIRDEQKSLIPSECTDNIRGDSGVGKTSTPLFRDARQSENAHSVMNNVETIGSPGCKLHHHHHHHHNISSLRTNATPLRLPLNSPKDPNKKAWNFTGDLATKPNKCSSVGHVEKRNNVVIEHNINTNQVVLKDDNKCQGKCRDSSHLLISMIDKNLIYLIFK
jgi:hypothetical protein